MKYDLSNEFERNKFFARLDLLTKKGAKVEFSELKQSRSLSQNAYLHVCISLIAIENGNHLEDEKHNLKCICPFMHEYDGKGILKTKKTSKLNTLEFAKFIEWIRNFASMELGIYIPSPDEYLQNKYAIDKEIESHKEYL